MAALCFVLMPFGKKPSLDGRLVDFDSVYDRLVKPSVADAGLQPLRADEEQAGGVIHKAMFERLILCEYAVADLTTANANVFYELGLRHATRPWATQLLYAEGWGQLPFDVHMLRALPYELGPDGTPANIVVHREALVRTLRNAQLAQTDSPVYQLVDGIRPPDVARLKTDLFREQVRYSEKIRDDLTAARGDGVASVTAVEASVGDIARADAGVVVDLLLSYRAVEGWQAMVDLVGRMSPPMVEVVMVREQLGFALNRLGRSEEAELVLKRLIAERGGSSESLGILGRVYKDRWEAAVRAGNELLAVGHLNQAISAYVQGFEADWRDSFPGINAVTLMELAQPPDARQSQLLPVVAYSIQRRIAQGAPDYWDYASRLELTVLANDRAGCRGALADALAHVREPWEPESTARNLRLIRDGRARRGQDANWSREIEDALIAAAQVRRAKN